MKKTILTLSLGCSLFFAGSVLADCSVPEAPAIPKGITATSAEMQKAKEDVKGFVDQAQEYVNCGVSDVQAQRMVAQVKDVVNKFNLEYRAYVTKS